MYPDVAAARRYTLVLGAGINAMRNVPGWASLVRRAWAEVFGEDADYRGPLAPRLNAARSELKQHGWNEEDLQRLDMPIHPLEPQFALELIDHELKGHSDATARVRHLVTATAPKVRLDATQNEDLLSALLVRCLYEKARTPSEPDTLSELARFIRQSKRLVRVITLNVDNLLEVEVDRCTVEGDGSLQVISRSRHRPGGAIPVYHLHGFLPTNLLEQADEPERTDPARRSRRRGPRRKVNQDLEHMTEEVPESVVFTDAQYWESVATPLSFTNYVFASALHDSSCIFVGLSMTDLNIIRWLGLHAAGFRNEYARELARKGLMAVGTPNPYIRHCWIRPPSTDPSGLLTRFLATRGVHCEDIRDWRSDAVRRALSTLLEFDRST